MLNEETAVPGSTTQSHSTTTSFEVTQKTIRNPYKMQFYLDHGHSDAGPWLVIGVNDTEYGVGYRPGQRATANTHLRSI